MNGSWLGHEMRSVRTNMNVAVINARIIFFIECFIGKIIQNLIIFIQLLLKLSNNFDIILPNSKSIYCYYIR
ncbi:MAG: hypothetical protein A2008_09745 [Candidatus Wallbacteria bacterium GWC2_49_35]|uniref:Uncharacterized protein n=1 Tax=Candidatus Wallbacteria bacterium GWC2_49_35 TaxID=1817813 RepID=A0A1F7WDN5_9BACT|nr:MAG: hypothetical protein A2008_09745 [Candidatus Wallbacteria bacterium GWC2_49_35]